MPDWYLLVCTSWLLNKVLVNRMENMEKFLHEFFAGSLKAYLKSEPIPESNDGPVKVRAPPWG